MSYGLKLLDDSQNIILSPETFTVRIVDVVTVTLGEMTPGQRTRVDVSPEVEAGMFAAVSPLYQYAKNLQLNYATEYYDTVSDGFFWGCAIYHQPSIPWVEVHSGHIYVCASNVPTFLINANGRPLLRSGHTLGDVAVYILTYN